uniref:Importin-beta domain, armadillo-type fold protein n=1 Tax=Tanacetum cinerariifolium TaxID=118510 RepID=A0A699HHN7_TANCI|nr:importin-beta domain, armadillo-type fold protein [Tanacetum cinerariifolium]
MFAEAVILIDDRLVKLIDITLEQWLDLKFGDHKKVDKEVIEGVVGTWLIQSYRKKFKEYMEIKRRLEVNGINTDVECEEYWWGKKEDEESREEAWSNYLPSDDNDAIQANQEWFDDHDPMEDDDDNIRVLDNYLISQFAYYYVDEKEEGFKERKCKLLGIPYKKPPTFKSEKFKVIKYSLGPAEEYVGIKEYQYDIWV